MMLPSCAIRSKNKLVCTFVVWAFNESGRFKFLKSGKELPTIMTSNVNCISTIMKCIAVVMYRANMKFQLSHAVIGDDATEGRHRRKRSE
nr:two-component response regulator-like APRR2 isoform X1 [Tanacetum cinerariifolium]